MTRRVASRIAAVLPPCSRCAADRRPPRRQARREGAALRVPRRRDRLRSGADLRPVFAHDRGEHLRRAATTYDYLARPVRLRPNTAAAHAGGVGATSRPSRSASGPASTSPTTRRSRASSASWSPRTTSTRSSATSTRAGRARPVPARERQDPRPGGAARGGARRASKPFDYDREVEGLRALDRYTMQFKLGRAAPALHRRASPTASCIGAVAREVVERYGDRIMEHPVGTGPFRLAQWRRSSLIVLERNPNYRERALRRASRPPTMPQAQAIAAQLQGPAAADGRPRRGRDHRGAAAALAGVPQRRDDLHRAACPTSSPTSRCPNNKLAPNLAKRGIHDVALPARRRRRCRTSTWRTRWSAATRPRRWRCAARSRWPSTSSDEIRARAHAARRCRRRRPSRRSTCGYDPAFKSEMSDYDPRAREGAARPVRLRRPRRRRLARPARRLAAACSSTRRSPTSSTASSPSCGRRTWTRSASASSFKTAQWPENLKAARAGKLMMWGVGWSAPAPDGEHFLALLLRPEQGPGQPRALRPAGVRPLYEQQRALPDGPEREALMREAKKLLRRLHAVQGARAPHLRPTWRSRGSIGYRRTVFLRDCWQLRRHRRRRAARRRLSERDERPRAVARASAAARRCRAAARRAARGRRRAQKVLRYAFEVAETSFDPAKINDLYSRTLTPHIFEALLHLRPPRAAGQDQAADRRRHAARHSDDFRVWTVGSSPASTSPTTRRSRARSASWSRRTTSTRSSASPTRPTRARLWSGIETERLRRPRRAAPAGARRARSRSTTTARSRACARSTATRCSSSSRSRGRASSRPWPAATCSARWRARWSSSTATQIDAHPVGTGPFRLAQWRRSSLIVLERNPDYREMLYDAEPAADDAEGQALLARFKGRRLPMVDRVEISIIEEEQPRWLAFLNGEADCRVPRRLPVRRRRRCRTARSRRTSRSAASAAIRIVEPAGSYYLLQHGRPGGRRLHARRRSRCAARSAWRIDVEREIRLRATAARRSPAQSPMLPHTTGYDPTLQERDQRLRPGARARRCSTCTATSTATATAGASCPTARRWCCEIATQPDQRARKIDELCEEEHDGDRHPHRSSASRSGPRT